jgi:uncharacterized integral membrane protein (TIGR00698 family)
MTSLVQKALPFSSRADLLQWVQQMFPGVLVAALVAASAKFLSEHYGAPAMLMALLLGIAVNFLGEEGKTVPGVGFAARGLLRLGVAFLGVRISADLMMGLGGQMIALVVGGVALTIGFALMIGRFFGADRRFALLTGGSVAICGASAAMALAAILPKHDKSEEQLIFTVVVVTLLSTLAMIAYPVLVSQMNMSDLQAGVFLGGTIHDVAQVVGAGFSVSDPTGDTSTLVKLIRVTLLAPIVLIVSFALRQSQRGQSGDRPPLMPGFVVGFLLLAGLNSLHLLPPVLAETMAQASRWLLLIAIAAVGMKTNLKQVLGVGPQAIALIVSETLFIAVFIFLGIQFLT